MNKLSSKVIILFLSFTMLITMAGCGKSTLESSSTTSTTTTSTTTTSSGNQTTVKAPITIRIMNRVNAEVNVEDNTVLREIEKRTNTKLVYEAPPIKNYVDRLNIIMASNDLPDVIYNWSLDANYEKWSQEGLFIALDDIYTKYPNLTKNITPDQWAVTKVLATGKMHAIPRPHLNIYQGFALRTDWLKTVGKEVPKTTAEFLDVAKAMTNGDPDKNGKADTFGFSIDDTASQGVIIQSFIMNAFDLPWTVGVPDPVDGQHKILPRMTNFIPYLDYLKSLYTEKALDPEFFLNKIYGHFDKMNMGRIGIVTSHQTNPFRALEPVTDNLTWVSPLPNSKGQRFSYQTPATWGAWAITKSAKNVAGVMDFMNWAFSDEGILFVGLGTEGKHYSKYDASTRLVERNADQQTLYTKELSPYMNFSNSFKGDTLFPEGVINAERSVKYTKQLNTFLEQTKIVNVPIVKLPSKTKLDQAYPDLEKNLKDTEVKFITGDISMDQFKKYLDTEFFSKTAEYEKEYKEIWDKATKK